MVVGTVVVTVVQVVVTLVRLEVVVYRLELLHLVKDPLLLLMLLAELAMILGVEPLLPSSEVRPSSGSSAMSESSEGPISLSSSG